MLKGMQPSEFGLWVALWSVDPWDETRADVRSGVVASMIANVHRDTKKHPGMFSPADFMPYLIQSEAARQYELSRRLRAALMAAGASTRKH